MILAIRAWDEPDAPTIGELAAHLLLKHHSAVGLVDRLGEHGLVERVRDEDDRRQVRVHLTAEGRASSSAFPAFIARSCARPVRFWSTRWVPCLQWAAGYARLR